VFAPRRIIALLGAALMLAGLPAAARAQDPSGVPPLSPTAPTTTTAPPPPPPPPSTTTTTPTATTPRTSGLPNTGTDPRVLALLGMALLIAGIGLRLRAPDGRF
jgi:LPXTG-motif cell wall-anchored protein